MKLKLRSPKLSLKKTPPTMFLLPCVCSKHNSTTHQNLSDAAVKQWTTASAESLNCWIPAGPSADCIPLKRIKTEPPDGEIIQVTVPGECLGAGGLGCLRGRGYSQEGTRCKTKTPCWVFEGMMEEWEEGGRWNKVILLLTAGAGDPL